jgi:polygalacturonase
LNAYDFTEPWTNNPYQDGGHCYFHNSLIWGENLTNVFITGHGMINGGGYPQIDHWGEPKNTKSASSPTDNAMVVGGGLVRADEYLDQMSGFSNGKRHASTWGAEMTNGALRLGNKAIALKLCKNVLIRDVTIFHGGHFAILVAGCDNLTVDNVTMDTDRDGIDIDCCRNTMVSNCRINSPGDDGLCPKSSFALGTNVITENLTIVNCQVSGFKEGTLLDGTMVPNRGTGRIKFGTEASGGFRNITVANCTFRSCHGLALEEVDGGIMENITINNLTMMDVIGYPIYITTGSRNRGPNVTTPSRARNIFISNVIATGIEPMSGIQITGIPGQPVEDVRLDNIRLVFKGGGKKKSATRVPPELGTGYPEPGKIGVMPAYGVFARHVHNLELANINVGFDSEDLRPAMVCSDVDGLEIDDFKAQLAPGVVAATFDSVTNVVIRNSPVLDGIPPR